MIEDKDHLQQELSKNKLAKKTSLNLFNSAYSLTSALSLATLMDGLDRMKSTEKMIRASYAAIGIDQISSSVMWTYSSYLAGVTEAAIGATVLGAMVGTPLALIAYDHLSDARGVRLKNIFPERAINLFNKNKAIDEVLYLNKKMATDIRKILVNKNVDKL